MRNILIFLFALPVLTFGQASPKATYNVTSPSHSFGANLPVGSLVTDVNTFRLYSLKASSTSSGTINTTSKIEWCPMVPTVDGGFEFGSSSYRWHKGYFNFVDIKRGLNMNGRRIGGVGYPIDPTDAVNKLYADGFGIGTKIKPSANEVAIDNIALVDEQYIDGVLTDEDTVLVVGQTDKRENGLYVTKIGSWERLSDLSSPGDFMGSIIEIKGGDYHAGIKFMIMNTDSVSVGVDSIYIFPYLLDILKFTGHDENYHGALFGYNLFNVDMEHQTIGLGNTDASKLLTLTMSSGENSISLSDIGTTYTSDRHDFYGSIYQWTGGIHTDTVTSKLLTVDGATTGTKFTSSIATGTSPYSCNSTTLNTNLNADLLDGNHASNFALAADKVTVANQADNRIITATGTSNTLNSESAFTFDGSTVTLLSNKSANNLLLLSNDADATKDSSVTVNKLGHVGIGTTNPTAPLNQKSTAAFESAPLGSELLTGSNWTATDWTGDFVSGFTHTVGNTTTLSNDLSAVSGNLYQISFTVSGRTAGTFTITFGDVISPAFSSTSAWGPKATGTGKLYITPTTDFNGTIVISIKQITGTTSPVYAIQDNTGTNNFEVRSSLASRGNTFIGLGAGRYNTTGSYNTANGFQALYSNTTGSYNTANGFQALRSNTTGSNNTANGFQALRSNTTGSSNTANGYAALLSNTTGSSNTANGYAALYSNTTGSSNTANGMYALHSNTTGSYNTANGFQALYSNTTGSYNTANGYAALLYNTTGSNNTANGYYALLSNTTGSYNTANGFQALYSNTTGSNNTANGKEAGRYAANGTTPNETSINSLYLGYDTRPLANADTNEIVIGASATGNGSNTVTLGNTAIKKTILRGNIGIGTTSPVVPLHVYNNAEALRVGDGTNTNSYIGISADGTNNRAMVGYYNDYAVLQGGSTKGIQLGVNNNTFGSGAAVTINSEANITISSLAGTGSRTVTADENGILNAPTSDARMKKDIRPLSVDYLGMLRDENIRAITYSWRDESMGTGKEIGFTAQMFEPYNIPNLTGTMMKDGSKYLNYDRITVLLWEQNKALLKKIESLEERIDKIEKRIK